MRVLLDTHVWLWTALDTQRIRRDVRDTLLSPTTAVYVSAASIWEISIKVGIHKISLPVGLEEFVDAQTGTDVAEVLPVNAAHALRVATLPPVHRDPFDRILIAQALVEGLTIVTADQTLAKYPVPIINAVA